MRTRSSGGHVPRQQPPSSVPQYPQRNSALHSPPGKLYHIQSCSRNFPVRSRNPSQPIPPIPPRTLKPPSPIPSSKLIPFMPLVTNGPSTASHKSYHQSHSLRSHLILRHVKNLAPCCLKFIPPTVSTGLPNTHSYLLHVYIPPSYLHLYPPSHSTNIHHQTNSVHPSLVFSMQRSAPKLRSLPCQCPRQKCYCPSNVTSRFAPFLMECPKTAPRMRSPSLGPAILRILRQYLNLHKTTPHPCSLSLLPMPCILSRPICEYYPWIATHFLISGIVVHQQHHHLQTRFPSFEPPNHLPQHPLRKPRPIKDLSSSETSSSRLALARKVGSFF